MTLESLNIFCKKTQTTPKKAGKQPRDVWMVYGQTQGYEALFRDLGGQRYHGQWSFWEDPTSAILERSDERMSFEDLQSYKSERKLAKAERYRGYAENALARSDVAYAGVKRISDGIPFGQPILIGHHSEKRARADQRRMDRGMRRSVEENRKANYFEEKSVSLEKAAERTLSLKYIGNRIEEKTAEIAKLKRYLNGQSYPDSKPGSMVVSDEYRLRLEGLLKDAEEALAHWNQKRAAFGKKLPSRESIRVGMLILSWPGWKKVIRVNAKSVTIQDQWPSGREFTRTIKYHEIVEFREARGSDSQESAKEAT